MCKVGVYEKENTLQSGIVRRGGAVLYGSAAYHDYGMPSIHGAAGFGSEWFGSDFGQH